MIEVELPDGTIAEFPDGTPQDTIKGVLQKRFGDKSALSDRGGFMGAVDAFGRGAADMMSFGFADEAAAGLGTGFGNLGDYDERLAQERATDRYDEENHPYARFAGQMAGGIAQGVGAARAVPQLLKSGWATLTGAGVGGGALYGGAYGFGSGEGGVENRVKSAIPDAGIGAATGAVAPLVARGVGNIAKKAAGGRRADALVRSIGMSDDSAKLLTRDLVNDNATPFIASPDDMLVDFTPSGRSTLDAFLQRGGPATKAARDAIEDRAATSGRKLTATLDELLGKPRGIISIARGIREGTAAARSRAYDTAYSRPINYASDKGMALENILKSRVPGSAVRKANELMRIDGHQSKQILARVADDGTVTFERLPDVMQIDYITEALGDIAAAADGQGKLGGTTRLGMKVGNLSSQIRELTKSLVPEYRTALDTAADAIRRRNAAEFGNKMLRASTSRDEVVQSMMKMGKAERQAVKEGVRSFIDDAVANVRRTVTDPNVEARQAVKAITDLSSDAARRKIGIVLGKKEADRLIGALESTARALDLRAGVTANSRTFGRQAANEALRNVSEPGIFRTFIEGGERGGVIEGIKRVIRDGIGMNTSTAREDAIVAEVVQALTGSTGADAERVAHVLINSGVKREAAEAIGARIARTLTGTLGGGGAAAALQYRR